MYLLSSLARKHGVRHVPRVAHAPHRHLLVPVRHKTVEVALRVFVGEALHQRREHQPGDHAVEPDPARCIDHRGGLRHLHQRRLARRVRDLRFSDVAQPERRTPAGRGRRHPAAHRVILRHAAIVPKRVRSRSGNA